MRLDDYGTKDGKRVWLTAEEIERLIDATTRTAEEIALTLGGKCGLRSKEIVSVMPNDFQHAPNGFVRVWGDYAKRDKYREAPIPDGLQSLVRGFTTGAPADEAVLGVDPSTVYRWLRKAAGELQQETGDEGWQYLKVHDLRRSWGGHLLWDCGVSPMAVMQFGGWEDWATFKKHYMGEMSPAAMERERAKLVWAGGDPDAGGHVFEPPSTAAAETYRA